MKKIQDFNDRNTTDWDAWNIATTLSNGGTSDLRYLTLSDLRRVLDYLFRLRRIEQVVNDQIDYDNDRRNRLSAIDCESLLERMEIDVDDQVRDLLADPLIQGVLGAVNQFVIQALDDFTNALNGAVLK